MINFDCGSEQRQGEWYILCGEPEKILHLDTLPSIHIPSEVVVD